MLDSDIHWSAGIVTGTTMSPLAGRSNSVDTESVEGQRLTAPWRPPTIEPLQR
jgi:hypothetical protein